MKTLEPLREHLARWLDIKSPSCTFAAMAPARIDFGGETWSPAAASPWYAVRLPCCPYESPELRDAARRVRRLIRKHWWVLLFEPDSTIAKAVRAAMAEPPVSTSRQLMWEEVRKLFDSHAVTLNGAGMRIFAEASGSKIGSRKP